MKKLFIILILIISSVGLQAQSIPDKEFTWKKTNQCIPKEKRTQTFLKVEEDPIISEVNQNEFENLMKRGVEKLNLSTDDNGTLKLKILFLIDQSLCLNEIGSLGIVLNTKQINILIDQLQSINDISYGTQRKRIVNCQGILYLVVKNGQLENIRNVNFKLKSKKLIHSKP